MALDVVDEVVVNAKVVRVLSMYSSIVTVQVFQGAIYSFDFVNNPICLDRHLLVYDIHNPGIIPKFL